MNADPYGGYERRYGYCIVIVMSEKNAVIMQDVKEKFRYRLEG
jgi:hypothetical protein